MARMQPLTLHDLCPHPLPLLFYFLNYSTVIMWTMKSIKVFLTEFRSSPLVCKPYKDNRLMTYLYRTQENIYLAGFRTARLFANS